MDTSLKNNWLNDLCKKKIIDVKTLILMLLMVIGLPCLVWAHHNFQFNIILAILIGTLLMNLSFTCWHECSHGNFSNKKWVNNLAGMVSSLVALYPGYFASKREHLIHHHFQGDKILDPVYIRIQCSFWFFPFNLLKTFKANVNFREYQELFPTVKTEKLFDYFVIVIFLGLFFTSIMFNFFNSFLFCWIIPRIIVFISHAYYICYLPHAIKAGGYQLYRIRKCNLLFRFLTVNQNYHGIHHKWVSIPWHRYGEAERQINLSNIQDIEVL